MIISKLIGGTGNQLYQFIAGKALALKHNTNLVLDISGYKNYNLHPYRLKHFNITAEVIHNPTSKVLKHYHEPHFNYDYNLLNQSDDTIIEGYWQSFKYFEHIMPVVYQEFSQEASLQNIPILASIKSCNSISVHFRRTDYTEVTTNRVHGIPTLDGYYRKALDIITSRVSHPVLFVFSDDIEWAKANFKVDFETKFVGVNSGQSDTQDLLLMSHCKHNLCANSTFSGWAAMLNQNEDKIVTIPEVWFAGAPERIVTDMFPPDWIRL